MNQIKSRSTFIYNLFNLAKMVALFEVIAHHSFRIFAGTFWF